ncbi:MAG: phospholipase D-like domain-containing protein, partial [Burkholderiaceae bacterium]
MSDDSMLMSAKTRLERAIAPQVAEHPGTSGVYLLRDGRDAFAARALLASLADRTLDVQYYIWDDDKTGTMMFNALRAAAERGVRVRLLLDDNNTIGLDEKLSALDALPNIEVRLFNHLRIRRPRWINYIVDFRRLNRRMHNKSITADGVVTIIGGRNVSDKYFDATEDMVFADLDVIGVGPVAADVETDFERYWNDESSCRVDRLLPRIEPARRTELVKEAAQVESDPATVMYVDGVRELPFVNQLLQRTLPIEWAPVRMISDDPVKVRGRAKREQQMAHKLEEIIGDASSSLDLV